MTLTKSEYLLFLKHRAWVWLKKYAKDKIPPIDAATQAIFDAGKALETYAYQLFPGGYELGFNGYAQYQDLADRTQLALSEGHTTLFQARFDAGQLICLTDVVVFTSPTTVKLYEIKSSTKIKDEHIFDLAFQVVVLEGAGYTVEEVAVIHINSSYVRQGEVVASELLTTSVITEQVLAKRELTKLQIDQAFQIISSSQMPDISPRHCRLNSLQDWMPIYRTLTEVPALSIYDLAYPTAPLIGWLEDKQIVNLVDIPDDAELSDKQRRQVISCKEGKASINTAAISEFLANLQYPLYFFDYETAMGAVPLYEGSKPYQQVPTQYSLHILDEPGGTLRHTEFIQRTSESPFEALSQSLRADIGDTGSILVWYAKFESSRNTEIGEHLAEFTDFFTDLNARMVDLMQPFNDGHYIHPDFMGSSSIKKVLPVLVPELSYKNLAVQEGQTAQRLWMRVILEGKATPQEQEQLCKDLLAYCELDTMAMVRIFEHLQQICK